MEHDHRHVVDLVRVRHAQQRLAGARAQPRRLIVHWPVERVAVAGLREQILGEGARVGAGAHPAAGRRALVGEDRVVDGLHVLTLGRLVHVVRLARVRAPVTHHLATEGAVRSDQLGAVLVALGVEQHAGADAARREGVRKAEAADPVAVLAPRPVVGVRVLQARRVGQAEAALVVGEVLDADRDVQREPLPTRPGEVRARRDRRVREATVARQHQAADTRSGSSGSTTPTRLSRETSAVRRSSLQPSVPAGRRGMTR